MVQTTRNSALLTALLAATAGLGGLSARAQESPSAAQAPQATAAQLATPTQQTVQAPKGLPGRALTLKTSDDWTLAADFSPAKDGKPTLILVHGAGHSQEIWTELARHLIHAGYGMLAFDLRGHGQSTMGPDGKSVSWRQFHDTRGDNDFLGMAHDVDAAADYLAQSTAAPAGVGIIGEGLGAALALRCAAAHPQMSLAVLISPSLNDQNVPLLGALRAYGTRPILIFYSQSDRAVADAAPLMLAVAKISAGAQNATMISSNVPADFLLSRLESKKILDWLSSATKILSAVAASSSAAQGQVDVSSPSAASPQTPAATSVSPASL